jgi:hypothetical protein
MWLRELLRQVLARQGYSAVEEQSLRLGKAHSLIANSSLRMLMMQ